MCVPLPHEQDTNSADTAYEIVCLRILDFCNARRGGTGGWRFRRILHFHGDGIGQIGAPRQLETRAIEEAFAMAARAFAGLEIFKGSK